jgi:hypothetical protein
MFDSDVQFREIAGLRLQLALVPMSDVIAATNRIVGVRADFVVVAATWCQC